MATEEIAQLEQQIAELSKKLHQLHRQIPGKEVKNYVFDTVVGEVTLLELFAGKNKLLVIHNMGQACRYCTLWADGINPFVPHLESTLAVALVSKDPPDTQRTFANSRNWHMRIASHGGGEYMQDQVAVDVTNNMPGAVVYELQGDAILRKASTCFGPGDLYCSHWQFLGLAGIGVEDWTPQYTYWQRPANMDDGGENVLSP